jgi:hypothetical protein
MACHPVAQRVQQISVELEAGLQRASTANQHLQRAVGKARADLARVRKESAALTNGGDKSPRAARALRSLIQKQVGPNIEDVGGRLATLADAAVVVSNVLEGFQDLPVSRAGRIKPDQWDRWADEVQALSATLRRLEGAVGDGDKEAQGQEVAAASSEVDLALQRCQAKVDDWQAFLEAASDEVRHARGEILGWLTPAALAVTVLLVWMALGQISLFAHALQWCRGA